MENLDIDSDLHIPEDDLDNLERYLDLQRKSRNMVPSTPPPLIQVSAVPSSVIHPAICPPEPPSARDSSGSTDSSNPSTTVTQRELQDMIRTIVREELRSLAPQRHNPAHSQCTYCARRGHSTETCRTRIRAQSLMEHARRPRRG